MAVHFTSVGRRCTWFSPYLCSRFSPPRLVNVERAFETRPLDTPSSARFGARHGVVRSGREGTNRCNDGSTITIMARCIYVHPARKHPSPSRSTAVNLLGWASGPLDNALE